ncbi:cytochrome P450, partial [Macrophomina phaseolina]
TALKYLSACVSETHRLTPVFTMPLQCVVPFPGATVRGAALPRGTEVSVCSHAVHHDEEVLDEDMERFAPERFLTAWSEKMREGSMSCGAGHRACIGRNLARVESNKACVSLVGGGGDDGNRSGGMPWMTSFGVSDLEGGLLVRMKRR